MGNSEYQAVRNLRAASILLACLVFAFGAVASRLSLVYERAQQRQSMAALAEVGAQSLDGYFLGLQSALRLVASEILGPDDQVDLQRAHDALVRLKRAVPDLRIATLAQLDGTIIASTESAALGRRSATLAAQKTFIEARDERIRTGNRNLTVGRAFYGPLSRDWVIPLGYGVWDSTGRLVLIVGAGLPLARPQGIWKEAPLPPGAALGVRRDDGYLLLRYPVPAGARLEDIYASPAGGPLGAHLANNHYPVSGTALGRSRISSVETLFSFRRLEHFPLTFFVANPTSNLLSQWWDRVWSIYVLLLVLLLAGYYVYRWALRRLTAWEQERARQIRMLEAANQELEDFAYTIAHDLKSPVRAIDGHAGIALETFGKDLPEGLRHRLGLIRRSAARMAELIEDLLEFSRYSHASLQRQDVDMTALAREVAAEQVPADAGIDLAIGELPRCAADPGLLRVVWTALISNAVKYSRNAQPPEVRIGYSDGAYFVQDNGAGFDMAHAAKLFGVFSRLHGADEYEGTGAGLAIARRILERHEGTIEAHGEPGRGATFRFTVGAERAREVQ